MSQAPSDIYVLGTSYTIGLVLVYEELDYVDTETQAKVFRQSDMTDIVEFDKKVQAVHLIHK